MDLKALLEKQKELELQIQQAIQDEKKNLKGKFDTLVIESGLPREEVLQALGLKDAKKSSPAKASQKIDLPKGTLLTNGVETWEVGSRGKKPLWVSAAITGNTYMSLVKK